MMVKPVVAALAATFLLSGCANGLFGGFLLGGNVTIAQAEAAENALIDRVDDIFVAEGLTTDVELPITGTANHTGIIHGFNGGGSGPDMVYFADLSVDVDFDTDTATGEITNFVTDLPGFENPTGTAPVAGTIGVNGGFAIIDFTAAGTLTGTNATADYDVMTTSGDFIGDSAQAARGLHESDFIWLTGPNVGTTISDGDWNIEE